MCDTTSYILCECVSKIRHVISVIHYAICGTVCFQLTHFPCDNYGNIYTLSYYYHHQFGSMIYYLLFRFRSWNNGMRCMSFYFYGIYIDIAMWNPDQLHSNYYQSRLQDIDGLVQETHNSLANALELRLSSTNPSIKGFIIHCLAQTDSVLLITFQIALCCESIRYTALEWHHMSVMMPQLTCRQILVNIKWLRYFRNISRIEFTICFIELSMQIRHRNTSHLFCIHRKEFIGIP